MYRPVLIGLSVLAMAACKPAETTSATQTAAATLEAGSEAALMEQERQAQLARAAADPVAGVIERAELCLHFGGEEAYDADRRAQINKAFEDNRCDAVVADGDALKASHPQDAARIDEALKDLRP